MTNPIRLLVVDDHTMLREAVSSLLANRREFLVVAQAADGDAALAAYERFLPDITLLDIRLPGIDGFDTLHKLVSKHPGASVIMLSGSVLPQEMIRARQLGARSFVPKQLGMRALCEAIERVAAGHDCWAHLPDRRSIPIHEISSRELHVLESARRGLTNAEIGVALSISEHTVKSHIKNILQKLHAADRAEAVARGFELGLLH